ncbi:Hypothetical Protein NTJ_11644 [Nesidiocoris tenuis]|uniref:Alpha-tubulin N-acetyltransferase n=1 Tax=Nesidiocoris tenuis TaxID=355587 RepID=A0ABN7B3J3_9HEMI|nr:Hypothetical Protein NTJ_11644 [Nesidiocoris tenuis]
MNFNYPIKTIFKHEITKLNHNLLPHDFNAADKRTYRAASDVVIAILDEMGIASAKAQGLLKPITSWDKLRNSEHTVYILVDREDNGGNGSVVGLLKIGKKKLYVFDSDSECHESVALCVLDFYVHESKQRMGCGRKLFDYMLHEENVEPQKLAIDRPSHKFLLFLQKYYHLHDVVPQSNNFVVFTGFFPERMSNINDSYSGSPHRMSTGSPKYSPGSNPYHNTGRHTAYKRESTIGQIIHSSPV